METGFQPIRRVARKNPNGVRNRVGSVEVGEQRILCIDPGQINFIDDDDVPLIAGRRDVPAAKGEMPDGVDGAITCRDVMDEPGDFRGKRKPHRSLTGAGCPVEQKPAVARIGCESLEDSFRFGQAGEVSNPSRPVTIAQRFGEVEAWERSEFGEE